MSASAATSGTAPAARDKDKKKAKRTAPDTKDKKAEDKVRGTAIVQLRGNATKRARITLTGPDSFRRVLRRSGQVRDLPVGAYSVSVPRIVRPDGVVRLRVVNRKFRVTDARRRVKVRVIYTFTTHRDPPAPAPGLTLLDRTPSAVELAWGPGAGPAVTGVVVRRAKGTNPPATPREGAPVPATLAGARHITDTGLAPQTVYTYAVFTRDATGAMSDDPDTLTVRTPQHQIYAVGDIGWCGGATRYTARLIPTGSVLLGLGDLAYFSGTRDDFRDCYHPFYGRLRSTTYPTPGNHEYRNGTRGYREYFGHRVGTRAKPWYALQLGSWRFLMLDSDCAEVGGCGAGSPQYKWVQEQLTASPSTCLAAAWHHPHWVTGANDKAWRPMTGIYRLLESAGADFVLTGHIHRYERFMRVSANQYPSSTGIRQFVVGTGGAPLKQIDRPLPTLESAVKEYGVLRLNLDRDGYSFQFVGIGDRVLDAGRDTCSPA